MTFMLIVIIYLFLLQSDYCISNNKSFFPNLGEFIIGEIKQTNFRIDSERADAFRAFCEENGLTQAQGFGHIMDVLAMNHAKEAVPGRIVEIEERYAEIEENDEELRIEYENYGETGMC